MQPFGLTDVPAEEHKEAGLGQPGLRFQGLDFSFKGLGVKDLGVRGKGYRVSVKDFRFGG